MDKDTRLNRLHALQDMLNRHSEIFPKTELDMTQWSGSPSNKDCKTAACVLGFAASYKPFTDQGLKLAKNRDPGVLYPLYEDHIGYLAGEYFFGLTTGEALDIFNSDNYKETPTLEKVNSKVSKIISKYEAAA